MAPDTSDELAQEAPVRRSKWRWVRRGVLALVLVALSLAVTMELGRHRALAGQQQRVHEVTARASAEIFEGKSAVEWHRARIAGENGWRHLAFVDEAQEAWKSNGITTEVDERSPQPIRLWQTILNMTGWDDAQKGLVEGDVAETSDLTLRQWLADTDRIAEGYALAAKCDVMSPVSSVTGEPQPWLGFQPIRERGLAARAFLIRNRLLRRFGATTQADRELIQFVVVCSKFQYPVGSVDSIACVGNMLRALSAAADMVESDELSAETAQAIAAIEMPVEAVLHNAVMGEACFLIVGYEHATWLSSEARLLDWWAEPTLGQGVFADMFLTESKRSRAVARVNLTRELADGIESVLNGLRYLDSSGAKDPADVAPVSMPDTRLGIGLTYIYSCQISWMRLRHESARIRLRLLERDGPLHERREAVEEILRSYRHMHWEWQGNAVILGVDPVLVEWRAKAEELELPPDLDDTVGVILESLRSDFEPPTLRIGPLGEPDPDAPDELD